MQMSIIQILPVFVILEQRCEEQNEKQFLNRFFISHSHPFRIALSNSRNHFYSSSPTTHNVHPIYQQDRLRTCFKYLWNNPFWVKDHMNESFKKLSIEKIVLKVGKK